MTGRFAPSPTGDLHLGNLRTAAIAWLSARSAGQPFIVRFEDLDQHQSSADQERQQLVDLASIDLDWDGEIVRQSDRFERYEAAIDDLAARDLVYECFCTRREISDEIAASAQAPHGPPGSYPGTCRHLSRADRERRRATGRPPALRLRTDGHTITFDDRLLGEVSGPVDDVVLRRNDGVPAYNLAVVVDDDAQAVSEVVRGDDLAASTPRQIHLQGLLGLSTPSYAHVPLVVDHDGQRLAKRRGMPVTLSELAAAGVQPREVVGWIASSLGSTATTLGDLAPRFDVADIPRVPCPVPGFAIESSNGRPGVV